MLEEKKKLQYHHNRTKRSGMLSAADCTRSIVEVGHIKLLYETPDAGRVAAQILVRHSGFDQ